jgi:hypothetical protein
MIRDVSGYKATLLPAVLTHTITATEHRLSARLFGNGFFWAQQKQMIVFCIPESSSS